MALLNETQVAEDAAKALRAARDTAAIFNEVRGHLVIRGKDRQSWLNGLLTVDVAKLASGSVGYGLAVSKQGKIITDLFVIMADDAIVLSLEPSKVDELTTHLDRYLVMEDAEIARGETLSTYFAFGPKSEVVMNAARQAGGRGGPSDWLGMEGAVWVVEADRLDRVNAEVRAALASVGGIDLSRGAFDSLRLELAAPKFAVDFDSTNYPQEANLEKRAVSFSKGCYLGQEVVCMLEMRGHVKKRLALLALEGDVLPAAGAAVTDADGTNVGSITSAAYSPTRKSGLALAMLKRANTEGGASLKIGEQAARVVDGNAPS